VVWVDHPIVPVDIWRSGEEAAMTTARAAGQMPVHVERLDDERASVRWADGSTSTYWSHWLRVLATDAELFVGTSAAWTDGSNFAPPQAAAGPGEWIADAGMDGDRIVVRWNDDRRLSLTARQLWLAEHDDPAAEVPREPWGSGRQWAAWPHAVVVDRADPAAQRELYEEYLRTGVAMISGVPRSRDALRGVAAALARVTSTHLEDLFDIRPEARPRHIGEVAAGVPVHIDLVYRQVPPTIQALHALRQIPVGGENIFVDALALAGRLDPADLRLLAGMPVDFVARSSTVHFRGRHPVLEVDPAGRFVAVA
jgi:Taurine catabolism dioxygenase TauD, TfdA family